MAKLIGKYACAKLKSVQKNQVMVAEQWIWRENFNGAFGTLSVFESEHKRPGETFAHLSCTDGNWLTTGCGKLSINNNELTITTDNSIYVFEISGKEFRL